MNKCLFCKTWYEPARDSNNKIINENYCEKCLENPKDWRVR